MKTLCLLPLAAACLGLAALHAADSPSAGYFDLGKFSPPKSGGQFVEVNLKGNILSFAAKVAAKEEPDVADLLKSIEAVRVNVIGLDDSNRADLKARTESIRSSLDTEGWERIVTVQDGGDDVGVYTKTRGQDSIAGVVVTVLSKNGEAVFVNVVGDIQPEKLGDLGKKLHIGPLIKAAEAAEAAQEAEKSEDKK